MAKIITRNQNKIVCECPVCKTGVITATRSIESEPYWEKLWDVKCGNCNTSFKELYFTDGILTSFEAIKYE